MALKSWGAPARLAKAVQLSGNSAVRFDAMTTLRLMADNTDCHPALLSSPVVKVIIHAASDKSDSSLRLKALRTIAAIAAAGATPRLVSVFPHFSSTPLTCFVSLRE